MKSNCRSHSNGAKNGHGRLVIGILSGILGVAISQSAVAQEDIIEEITVTGIRGSLQTALNIKQAAEGIVDAISAEDVGRFPDQNLAESLQRITGVQITRSEGEGQTITIRGLPGDFTRVQFNGRTLPSFTGGSNYAPSGAGGRSFDFSLLPSSFVSELVVYKTPTADIEEGGIAGTVQVKTIRPLDLGQRVLSANAIAVNENNDGDTTPKVNMLYSDVFADGTFGVTLGAHFDKRAAETHQFVAFGAEVGVESGRTPPLDYNLDGDFDDTIRFHHENRYTSRASEKERTTAMVNLQWQPTDSTDTWFETLYTQYDQDTVQNALLHRFTQVIVGVTGSHIVPDPMGNTDGFAEYLKLNGVDYRGGQGRSQSDSTMYSLALGGSQEFGEWTAEVELSVSEAESLSNSMGVSTRGAAHVSYDFRGQNWEDVPALVYADDFDPLDPTNYRVLGAGGSLNTPTEDNNTDIRLDVDRNLEWNLGSNITVTGLEIGSKFSSREKFVGRRSLDVRGEELAPLLGETFDPTRTDGGFSAEAFATLYTPNNFLDGYDGPRIWPSTWLVSSNDIFLNAVSIDDLMAAGTILEGGPREFRVTEDVQAAYAKLNFEGFDGRFSGNLGVRYVYTDQQSDGFFPDPTTLVFDGGGGTEAESSNSSVTRNYSEVLPSFNMRYQISDEVTLRFAAARVMSRPTLTVLSPSTFYNVNTRLISSNNPNVDPFIADQVDLSLEWYFGDTGFLSFAPFMKDIKSFIVAATNREQVTYFNRLTQQTVTDTFTRFQPDNGNGSTMFGYEVNWIQPLDALIQGLGFQANFTFVDAEDVQAAEGGPLLSLTGLSRTSYNLIGFYENDMFGIRLAYNQRDPFVINPTSHFGDGQIADDYTQLDLSANYNVNDNISIYLEALNLTEEVQLLVNSFGLNRGIADSGRRLTLGVHASF